MNTNDFDFYLPEELIAQTPLEKRDASKLLVIDHRVITSQKYRGRSMGSAC